MSISLNINRFERLSGRLFLLLSHEKKVRRRKMSPLYEASSDMSSMTIFSMLYAHSHPGVGGKPCLFKPVTF